MRVPNLLWLWNTFRYQRFLVFSISNAPSIGLWKTSLSWPCLWHCPPIIYIDNWLDGNIEAGTSSETLCCILALLRIIIRNKSKSPTTDFNLQWVPLGQGWSCCCHWDLMSMIVDASGDYNSGSVQRRNSDFQALAPFKWCMKWNSIVW